LASNNHNYLHVFAIYAVLQILAKNGDETKLFIKSVFPEILTT